MVTGEREHAAPDVLVTDEVGVRTIATGVLEVRRRPDPLVGAPRVTVTTVLGTPAVITVVAVMVALKVVVLLFLMKLPLVFTEPRFTELPRRWNPPVSPLLPVHPTATADGHCLASAKSSACRTPKTPFPL